MQEVVSVGKGRIGSKIGGRSMDNENPKFFSPFLSLRLLWSGVV